MSRRWYVCDVIGTGTQADPYRPIVAGSGRGHAAVIPSNSDGTPMFAHCVVKVAAANHASIAEEEGVDQLPDTSVEEPVSQEDKDALLTKLIARGMPSNILDGMVYPRQIVRAVGRYFMGTFREDVADVSD